MHYQLTFNGVIVGESGCFRGSYFAWVMHNALISRDKSALFSGIGHICEITRQVVAERKVSTPLRSLGQRNLYHTSKLFILLHNVFNRDFVACNHTFCLTTKLSLYGRFFQRIVTRVIHSTRCRWFWIWSDVLRLPYLKGSVQSFTLFLIIIIITLTIIIIIIIIVIIIIIITTVNITLIIIINTIINIVESFTLFLIIIIILC